jgi:hypothetical protein
MNNKTGQQLREEFDRQVENLLQKGYPEAAGLPVEGFLRHIEPLIRKVEHLVVAEPDWEKGYLPFVIVIKSSLVETEEAMLRVLREGKQGIVKLYPHQAKDFDFVDEVVIPNGMAYLLAGIDRGKASINVAPIDALKMIKDNRRSPLTIDEGVAVVTQCPDFLTKNNGFSLLASRHDGDKRVPAIWINAEKKANLGWCWDGNPHTWLGSASCKRRIGP